VSSTFIRVVKVGGSLLDLEDLPDRLRQWLDAQRPAHNVIVVGGGPLVEQVRIWNDQRPFDDAHAHWMCIDLLAVTSRLLHAWLPEMTYVDEDRELCQRVGQPGATIFAPGKWLRNAEPGLPGVWLPSTWETTSDAIAGRLAVALAAHELALLKSTLPTNGASCELTALAAIGYLDRVLARMEPELPPTRLIDLRSRPYRETAAAQSDD